MDDGLAAVAEEEYLNSGETDVRHVLCPCSAPFVFVAEQTTRDAIGARSIIS